MPYHHWFFSLLVDTTHTSASCNISPLSINRFNAIFSVFMTKHTFQNLHIPFSALVLHPRLFICSNDNRFFRRPLYMLYILNSTNRNIKHLYLDGSDTDDLQSTIIAHVHMVLRPVHIYETNFFVMSCAMLLLSLLTRHWKISFHLQLLL